MRSNRGVCVVLLLAAFASAQTNEIIPPENFVVEGIPRIPPSLVAHVARYSEFRSARREVWHPVRREMLISTRFGDTEQLHLVKSPGATRTQLTFPPERSQLGTFAPKDGNYFLYFKDVGGNERYQIYRYDLATKANTLITDGQSRNAAGAWSNDGEWFAYRSTRRNGKNMDIWVINPANPETNRLLFQVSTGRWGIRDWSPDDRQILMIEYVSDNDSRLWTVDSATGEKTPVTPKVEQEKILYNWAKFSRDGKGIYVLTDSGSEFQRIGYIDLTTRQFTFLTSQINWDVEQFDLSSDGKTLAFTTNEDGISVLHLLDARSHKDTIIKDMPVGIISDLEWHKNGQDLGFSLESTRSPSDAYSYNVKNRKLERWTYSEVAGLNTDALPEPQLVRWKGFDGRVVSGFLYLPPARFTGKRPVMIRIHGGPVAQSRPGFLGRINYYLNEMGIALFFPNVRGSEGYGKTFSTLDNGLLREGAYKDIGALLDWIQTRPELDANRIMVTGTSYGGHMTLAVAANYPNRIRCALDIVGPSSLVTFLDKTEESDRASFRDEYGNEQDTETREFLERIAPLSQAAKITKPLFVVAGKNDPRVAVTESEQIVAKVRENGTPVWYLLAKDEGHGFAKKGNQDFLFYAAVEFASEYLLK
jgi:dipeptidyl aminopeptidase/acylaminoacyl peptidase